MELSCFFVGSVIWICLLNDFFGEFQDEKLLQSTRLTERAQLWEKYGTDVDQHTVKLDFLRKVHRVNPPFKVKVKHGRKRTVKASSSLELSLCFWFENNEKQQFKFAVFFEQVPQYIRDHYEKRPPLIIRNTSSTLTLTERLKPSEDEQDIVSQHAET